ncbi:MAG: threonine ammonia-lyase [Phycisphaeraceae bacterium]
MITYADILRAQKRIADAVQLTPCPPSPALSELTGCDVYCKLDYLQRTGSFKERGARNALMQLDKATCRGVIAASAGNHALALAYHGKLLGIPVTVVMPRFAPMIKVTTCRRLGANVVLHGDDFATARAKADQIIAHEKLTYIHGYDAPEIIAGQGTIGLEIIDQVPDLDAVIMPIGGGGLIAGASLAIKARAPDVQVIGVESDAAAGYSAALQQGSPVNIQTRPTLADGLAVGRVGDNAFAIAKPYIDRVVTVKEDQIALAILHLLEQEKSVVEGAGAAPLAALLSGQLADLAGRRVAIVLCGGNIDPTVLRRVIDHGMVTLGRLFRFTAVISDRPGGLERLAHVIASSNASVRDISHDRAFAGPDVATVRVDCTVETTDADHITTLKAALHDANIATHTPH